MTINMFLVIVILFLIVGMAIMGIIISIINAKKDDAESKISCVVDDIKTLEKKAKDVKNAKKPENINSLISSFRTINRKY